MGPHVFPLCIKNNIFWKMIKKYIIVSPDRFFRLLNRHTFHFPTFSTNCLTCVLNFPGLATPHHHVWWWRVFVSMAVPVQLHRTDNLNLFSLFLRRLRSWKSRFCYTPPTVLLHRCAKNRSTVSLFFVHQIFVLTVLCTNVLSFCTRKKKSLPVPTLSHIHTFLHYLFVICLPFKMFCLKIASIPEPQTGHAQVHNTKNRLNFKQFTFCMPSFLLLRYLVLNSVKYFMDTPLFFCLLLQSLYYFKVCFPKRNFFFRAAHANLSKVFQAGLGFVSVQQEIFYFV